MKLFRLDFKLPSKMPLDIGLNTSLSSEHYTQSSFTSIYGRVNHKLRDGGGLGEGWLGSQLRPGSGSSWEIEDMTMGAPGSGESLSLPQGIHFRGIFFSHFGSWI